MRKVSCIFLLLIAIGYCSNYDKRDTAVTEISRNARNHEKRKLSSDGKRIDSIDDSRPYDDDNNRQDTTRTSDGKLLGNWRNNGAAFEPKWRDGDSVPLVPFNAAKHAKPERHEYPRDATKLRDWDSSHAVTKVYARHEDVVGRTGNEESVEDTIEEIPSKYSSSAFARETKVRYNSDDVDYETNPRYRTAYESEILSRGRAQRPALAVLTDELRYETTEDLDASGETAMRARKQDEPNDDEEDSMRRSRYRETFQAHPNEYELNDEEYQKPRPRKRRPPQNYEFSEFRAPTYSITWSTERYVESVASSSRPSTKQPEISTRRRVEQKNSSIRRDRNRAASMDAQRVSENAELKSLLKMQQIEGLSLSEILQRRNLTLNDLLRGKADALNVLKSTDSNEDSAEFSSIKPKIFEAKRVNATTERTRWKPSQPARKKIFDHKPNEVFTLAKSDNDLPAENDSSNEPDVDDDSMEKLDSAETEDGRRKANDNEKLSAIVRLTKPIILPRSNSLNDKFTIVSTTTPPAPTTERVTKDIESEYQNDQSGGNIEKTMSNIEEDEIMEFSDFTMKKHFPVTTNSPMYNTRKSNFDTTKWDEIYEEDSGSTLSIEHILSPTEQTSILMSATTEEPSSFDSKANNVFVEATRVNDTDMFESFDYQSDEPREIVDAMEIDEELPLGDQPYEKSVENSDNVEETRDEEALLKNHQIFSTSNKPYEVVVSEIEPEARAEIFELFSSGSSAKRLERLLKSRNMSIDELIALRQRGSSKVHLAEVSRSKETLASRSQKFNENYRAPEQTGGEEEEARTTEGIFEVKTTTASTDDLSDIEIDSSSESIGTTEQQSFTTDEHTSIYGIATEREETLSTTERNTRKNVQLLELLTAFDSLPFSVRPDLDSASRSDHIQVTKIPRDIEVERALDRQSAKISSTEDSTSYVEVGFVEEILKEDSSTSGNLEESNISGNYSSGTDDRNAEDRKISSKVRPSIIASGAILGLTIVVFLAIFIVCRIRQKQKYTYRNTFSRAVFQGPVMTARKLSNSSSLNTIMVNVVATSTTKRPDRTERRENQEIDDDFEFKSDIENDSLDANDSWETIPDFMK